MGKRNDILACEDCGILVETIRGCESCEPECELTCCGEPLELMEANTTDAAGEKHVPVIEKIDGGFKITVGSVAHPMEDEHWIEWIEVIAGDRVYKAFLNPGQAPSAEFLLDAESVVVREYCNLHGLWEATN